MQLSRSHYTFVGCLAPICWGMSVPFVRLVAEHVGQPLGMTLLCGIASFILLAIYGVPPVAKMSRKFLICGVGMAMACEVCFCFALATSNGGAQTAEVGMVNYLWPCLTMLFACLFNGQKAKWWIVFGFAFAVVGIMTVLSGDAGLDLAAMWQHMKENPVSYAFAVGSAVTWAAYSSITRAMSRGANPVVLIFWCNTAFFFLLWILGVGEPAHVDGEGITVLVIAAVVMGLAYALWTVGVMKGSMTVMAVVSYFTPVLSCVFCALFLGADLSLNFWKGVGLVVAGSLICWAAAFLADRVKNPA